MINENLFCFPEETGKNELIAATYSIRLPKSADAIAKAASLAIGQTIGTWVPIPGITEEMEKRYMGKVIQVFHMPSSDLTTMTEGEEQWYLFKIGYPAENFTADFPLLLTSLLGNDASTSAQVKLLDIEFTPNYIKDFPGPRFGIDGFRKLAGEEKRPLLLNMIKPCTGLTPREGAKIFYQTALGGVDFIKDDELLGSPSYSKAWERVKAYHEASRAAFEETGKEVIYIVNVTDGASSILDTVKRVEEAGAKAMMVNFAAVGYSMLQQLAGSTTIPILAHSAGAGVYFEGNDSGMSSPLSVGKLARIAGADAVMMNTPYGGYPLAYEKYMQTAQQLSLPFYHMKPAMPSVGGGVHPGIVNRYIKEVGHDIILAAGGAITGHPMGAAAGAKAMQQAIEASMEGIDIEEKAGVCEELRCALKLWGKQ